MHRGELTDRARALRVDQTRAERRLWDRLRNRQLGGWKWRRQVPRGHDIVDFLCSDAGLAVELDGEPHIGQTAYDDRRTRYLEDLGLRVLRISNGETSVNLDGVCDAILAACGGKAPHPALSPQERGEGS
jgi:very-short-patch-repair endonuclease